MKNALMYFFLLFTFNSIYIMGGYETGESSTTNPINYDADDETSSIVQSENSKLSTIIEHSAEKQTSENFNQSPEIKSLSENPIWLAQNRINQFQKEDFSEIITEENIITLSSPAVYLQIALDGQQECKKQQECACIIL